MIETKILLECLGIQKELVSKHASDVIDKCYPYKTNNSHFLRNFKTYGMILPRQIGKSTIAINLCKQYENPIILCFNKKEADRIHKQYNVLCDSISNFINKARGVLFTYDAYILDEFEAMDPEQIEKLYKVIPLFGKQVKDIDVVLLSSKL